MVEPADFRLGKLHAAEFLGIIDRDPPHVGDRFAAAFDAEPLELLEGLRGGADGLVDAAEDAIGAGERSGGGRGSRRAGRGGGCGHADRGRGRAC